MSNARQIIALSKELSGRWVIPILLALESSGGRFTPLQNQLQIAPARLSGNLKQLNALGLLRHLSPYERRHPLLPEYQLTDKGRLYREAAKAMRYADTEIGHGLLSARAWNMPVLIALHMQYDRFQDIRTALGSITPRMLSMRLDELNGAQLIDKQIMETPRPTYAYGLTAITEAPVSRMADDLHSLL
ncbi:winged helix-turn-helix transcriptional regulator [Paenibacillus chungangensis]|uniref:Winged helix-turn-helix transcriptional regulator n=1 Tax=Paenibacillus chungangensis TaxID=696535 RepID=A0ABW3HJV4_9BACL